MKHMSLRGHIRSGYSGIIIHDAHTHKTLIVIYIINPYKCIGAAVRRCRFEAQVGKALTHTYSFIHTHAGRSAAWPDNDVEDQ